MFQRITLNVASIDLAGKPVGRELRSKVVDNLLRKLATLYGGAKVRADESGSWLDDSGQLVVERSLDVYAFNFGDPADETDVRALAKYVARALNQSAVLWSIESVPGSVGFEGQS